MVPKAVVLSELWWAYSYPNKAGSAKRVYRFVCYVDKYFDAKVVLVVHMHFRLHVRRADVHLQIGSFHFLIPIFEQMHFLTPKPAALLEVTFRQILGSHILYVELVRMDVDGCEARVGRHDGLQSTSVVVIRDVVISYIFSVASLSFLCAFRTVGNDELVLVNKQAEG